MRNDPINRLRCDQGSLGLNVWLWTEVSVQLIGMRVRLRGIAVDRGQVYEQPLWALTGHSQQWIPVPGELILKRLLVVDITRDKLTTSRIYSDQHGE